MSAFVLRRIAGAYETVHRDTGTRWLLIEPYLDLWPLRELPTHWIFSRRILFWRVSWRRPALRRSKVGLFHRVAPRFRKAIA